ncbi:hypothetical protein GCM10007147_16980 [Nocardiopsis kunsanensis]|uniref:RidA family protein n=2 Tax=Nocardiopsis kunsanensis TaxID=141693 RepID=A0A918XBK8_9ACTN|nr:hypothetical protein GCM10007147_16980 [Nocardiopsis kunsanensis]
MRGYVAAMAKPYSDALVAPGPLLFLSGQFPVSSDGEVPGDVAGQTRQVFTNMERLLAGHGADLGDLVKITYYLRHITDLDEFRSALSDCLPRGHRPAGTLVEVSGLVDPRYLVQVEGIASLGER